MYVLYVVLDTGAGHETSGAWHITSHREGEGSVMHASALNRNIVS